MENPYPLYYKWVHPNPKANGMVVLVLMEGFAHARFWDKTKGEWGPVDMGDLAESIDQGAFPGGAAYEQISEAEAEALKTQITSASQ